MPKPLSLVSWDDYEKREAISEVRHEYVNGQVYAMAGASANHNRITLNIAAELRSALRGKKCEAFKSDMRLKLDYAFDLLGYYPDVLVACDPKDNARDHRKSPTVIFEVLSASTERVDRREKLLACQGIASLEEYVLVEQRMKRVTVHRRKNHWKPEVIEGDRAMLKLASLGVSLKFADIYERVDWKTVEEPPAII
jgi:Uma2 family endonuclease